MSYILEALKKAQAERQLGSAPTIHAPQPPAAAPRDAAAGSRKALLLGLAAGGVVVAAGALFLWRPAHTGAPAVLASAGQGGAPASVRQEALPGGSGSPATLPATSPATSTSPLPTSPHAAETLAVRAPPAPVRPRSVETSQPAARPPAARSPATGLPATGSPAAGSPAAGSPAAPPSAAMVPPAAAAAAPPAMAQNTPAAAPEDGLPFLQQLPQALQQQVPRVAFGGYMYSSNPADRLLLIDKVLRHEGEEVAPGLVLEKLLPRAAVMNFRGVRYRVGY